MDDTEEREREDKKEKETLRTVVPRTRVSRRKREKYGARCGQWFKKRGAETDKRRKHEKREEKGGTL